MALLDVKEYYAKLTTQYVELKSDLNDFEQALKDGYITEDKLESVKEDVLNVKNNLDRISYILYLFELPRRKNKKVKYKQKNQDLITYFNEIKADENSVIDENVSIISHLRSELEKFKK